MTESIVPVTGSVMAAARHGITILAPPPQR